MRSLRSRLEAAFAWGMMAVICAPLFAFLGLGLILSVPFILAGHMMLKAEEPQ